MKRRDLLKSLPALLAIPLGVLPASTHGSQECSVPPMPLCRPQSESWRSNVARQMILESGEMWLSVRNRHTDREPVVVGFDDELAVEITRGGSHWRLIERVLTETEARELREYRQSLYHIHKRGVRLGDRVGSNEDWRVRAYVKNGRRPGWCMSVSTREPVRLTINVRRDVSSILKAVTEDHKNNGPIRDFMLRNNR